MKTAMLLGQKKHNNYHMTERTNILEDQRWKWKEETLAGVPDVCQGLVGK